MTTLVRPENPARARTRRIAAQLRRASIAQRRDAANLFTLFGLPIIDVVMFGAIGAAYGTSGAGDTTVNIILSGLLLIHLLWQVVLASSIGLLEDIWSSNLVNLIATPTTETEYVTSQLIVGLARAAISITMVALASLVFFGADPDAAGWVLVPAFAVLILFGTAMTMLVMGLTIQLGESAEVFSWGLVMLVMPISGIFYPISSLPGAVQPLARAVPITQVFEAARVGIETGEVAWSMILSGALGSLVLMAVAWQFARWQLRRFRRNGWVTRFT